MIVNQTETFAGWDRLRDDIATVGPLRLLGIAVEKIHREMDGNGLRFIGDQHHNYINHPPLARVLVRMICDGVDSPRLSEATSAVEADLIGSVLHRLSSLAGARTGDDFIDRPCRSRDRVSTRSLRDAWLNTLEIGPRHNFAKAEIGRTMLMLRRFWKEREPDVLKKKGIALRQPLSSAFEDLDHYLWLHIQMLQSKRIVGRPEGLLGGALDPEALLRVVNLYVPDASEVVGTWQDIENSPVALLDNPFMDEPIVRLPDGGLVAPDPGLLTAGLPNRLLRRTLAGLVDDQCRAEAASTLIGFAFEEYGRALLGSCEGETFVQEFELEAGGDSPDGFLVSDGQLGQFEFKAKRHPAVTPDVLRLSGLRRWMGEVAGERRDDGKAPYQQYVRFLEEWSSGDPAVVDLLGHHEDYEDGFYALVSFDNVPFAMHWDRHRQLLWGDDLHVRQAAVDGISVFLSIAELEHLVGLVEAAANDGKQLSALQILTDWKNWLQAGPKAVFGDQEMEMRGPLRSYLQQHYTEWFGQMPDVVGEAYDQAFAGVAGRVYGEELEEAVVSEK